MIKKVASNGHAKNKAILVFASDTGCCPDGHKRCKYELNIPALFPVTEITVTKIDGNDLQFLCRFHRYQLLFSIFLMDNE